MMCLCTRTFTQSKEGSDAINVHRALSDQCSDHFRFQARSRLAPSGLPGRDLQGAASPEVQGCLQAGLYQLSADPIFAASSRPASQKIGWDQSRFRATFAPYTIAPKILLFSPECGGPEHLLHTLQGLLYASRSFAKISKL